MRRSEFQPLGSVIKEFLKEKKFDGKLSELDVINSWEKIIGKGVARATTSITIKEGTLFLQLRSSVVRQELFMMRQDIIRAVNDYAGRQIVTSIVLK